jgi:hypothetical protein
VENTGQNYLDFRRTDAKYLGPQSDEDIIAKIIGGVEKQILVIVNTRKHAISLYQQYNKNNKNGMVLSTLLPPAQRTFAIETIKEKLKKQEPLVVFSTSLVECGVNLDFECVYRSLAGLDNIVQSAGRCNREGKRETGSVYCFKSSNEFDIRPRHGGIDALRFTTEGILCDETHKDIIGLDAINKYYETIFEYNADAFDMKKISGNFRFNQSSGFEFDFAKTSEDFRLIETDMVDIIIPYNNKYKKLLADFKSTYNKATLRELKGCMVSVYRHEAERLKENGGIVTLGENVFVLTDMTLYNEITGLDLLKQKTKEEFIWA